MDGPERYRAAVIIAYTALAVAALVLTLFLRTQA